MREVHLFPGKARTADVRATARAALEMPPAEADRYLTSAADRHAATARAFGDNEAVIAADAAGFRRAVEDERARFHVEAAIADPVELAAAQEIATVLRAALTG